MKVSLEQENLIRNRARQKLSLTGNQACFLVEDRDEHFKMMLGVFNALMTLRAFMADDAPQWAKDTVKAVTDKNDVMIEEFEKFKAEHTNG